MKAHWIVTVAAGWVCLGSPGIAPSSAADRPTEGPQTAQGLTFEVDFQPSSVTLRRRQDVLTADRGLPGVLTGTTDPLIAFAWDARGVRQAADSWVHRELEWDTTAGTVRAIVSRLSPAVLLDSPEKRLRLTAAHAAVPPRAAGGRGHTATARPDGRLPRYLAWPSAGQVRIHPIAADGPDVPLQLDEPWMLAWFGSDAVARGHVGIVDIDSKAGANKPALAEDLASRLDVPLLLRLEHRPSSLKVVGGQILLEFPQTVGKAAVMPLFGRRIWLPEETEAWRARLPEEVVQQCRQWSRWLRDYPLTVAETHRVDTAGDSLIVAQTFSWESLDDDWQTPQIKAAPLPPMLGLALPSGVPVTFLSSGQPVQPVDGGLMDLAGTLMMIEGADAYEYQLSGLAKYLGPPISPAPVAPETEPLRIRLQQYVSEMLQAGHLRPLFFLHGGLGTWNSSWYWVGTPETAYALARAHPYLPPEMQDEVRRYVRSEWEQYPPLELGRRSYADGAPREPYAIDGLAIQSAAHGRDEAYRRRNFLLDLYRIETAARVLGELPAVSRLQERAGDLIGELIDRQDWAILGPTRLRAVPSLQEARFSTLQGSAAYNAWLAGAIGAARLARQHGWQEIEPDAVYLAGKLALARIAQAHYVSQMHRMGLVRGDPEQDYRAVVHIDQTCTVVRWGPVSPVSSEDQEFPPFIDLVPETGRLLGDYARAPCARYLDYLDDAAPYWYSSEAPKQSATEHRTCPLWHLSGNVPAQSWILGKTGREFARYVDVTRFRGDLFAIHNLVTAITQWPKLQESRP